MRLFVSLLPPGEVAAALPALPRGLRPVPAGQHHVTLAFLGEVADQHPVADGLEQVLAGARALRLRLSGAGTFGSVVWLGLSGDDRALAELAGQVQAAVRRAGVPLEHRPWHAHLTVGRWARGRGVPAGLAAYEGPAAAWHQVELVRSSLLPGGARHEALRRWELPAHRGPA